MSLPHVIMWLIVLAVGVPSAWRNPTAGALVLCWVFSEAIFTLTGNGLAVDYFIFPDLLVLAVILAKPEVRAFRRYSSIADQLRCIFTQRSVPDRIVMTIFPVMWAIYVSDLHPYYQWWSLWWLSIAQFLAAGWEGTAELLRLHPRASPNHPSDDMFHRLVWGHG